MYVSLPLNFQDLLKQFQNSYDMKTSLLSEIKNIYFDNFSEARKGKKTLDSYLAK